MRGLTLRDVAFAAAGPFDPMTLTPAGWYDFSDAATVTLNGSDISQINDKSGNSRHLTQGTAGKQPAYTLAGQNGLNVATFTAANADVLSSASLTLAQPLTHFMVAKVTSVGSGNFNLTGNGGATGPYLLKNSTFWQIYSTAVVASTTADDNATHVHTMLLNGASSLHRLDGVQTVAGNAGTRGYITEPWHLGGGAAGGGASNFDGVVGEWIICPSITAQQRLATEAYLKAKWGTP